MSSYKSPRAGSLITALAALALLLTAGCASVGPDYHAPEPNMPERWNATSLEAINAGEADEEALAAWWENLNDPVLTGLIHQALANNHDIRTALARVRESRARLGISEADRYPTLEATGSARWNTSESKTGSTTTQSDSTSYSIGLDAAWELDLFGGTRRAIEATEADLSSSEEQLRGARVTLAAEVALTYIKVREYQHRIAITLKNLSALEEEAGMVRAQKESGLASELELAQANETLAGTRAQLPPLYTILDESLNALAILLGLRPGALHEELSEAVAFPLVSEDIAAGVPADLLRRRPDIRQAERELAAETARVGVATSELYPKFSLTGSFVYEEITRDTDGTSTTTRSRTAGLGPSIRWALFSGGAIRRNIDVQSARQEQALIAYEQTVLTALGEVENALAAYYQSGLETESLREAVAASREAESLTNSLYQAGLDDFESLLNARKNLLSLESRLVQSEAGRSSNLIGIYKALGGGWGPGTEPVNNSMEAETSRRVGP